VKDTKNNTTITHKEVIVVKTSDWCEIPGNDPYYIMKYEVTNYQYLNYLERAFEDNIIWIENDSIMGKYNEEDVKLYEMNHTLMYKSARISHDGIRFILNIPEGSDIEAYYNHPVTYISWYGAKKYAEYYGWEIPTEDRWTAAAVGTFTWKYPWGNTISKNKANIWNSGDPFDNGTTPIGYYDGSTHNGYRTQDGSSRNDLYDMCGNVREWTYEEKYDKARTRGGHWFNGVDDWELRVDIGPGVGNKNWCDAFTGFRCVKNK